MPSADLTFPNRFFFAANALKKAVLSAAQATTTCFFGTPSSQKNTLQKSNISSTLITTSAL
jgi:hypothetical protein